MFEVMTQHGNSVQIISCRELRDPLQRGDYVRAYCHIHGSDHQRSLSINRKTGWGLCFNAACNARVLVSEWSPRLAERLVSIQNYQRSSIENYVSAQHMRKPTLQVRQPVLILPPATPPQWQQEERQALLSLDEAMRWALAHSRKARVYLQERAIPFYVAQESGVGYLPPELLKVLKRKEQRMLLQRWTNRILFPLHSPEGRGYIGRSLWNWTLGMDEQQHKTLLELPDAPRRWIKTNPAGWFGYNPDSSTRTMILVEGAFDRLALLAAGMPSPDVIALAGTAVRPDWVPADVTTLLLALDADAGGEQATERLIDQLEQAGLYTYTCKPPLDGRGIDWSERWRKAGYASLRPLFEAHAYCSQLKRWA